MTTQEQYIARLKEFVEAKFGQRITTIEDCDALSEAVGEATNIKLDSRAFMPIFVHDSRAIAPRPVTLSTLARYLGYNSWSEFCTSSDVMPAADADIIPVTRRWGVIILTILALGVVVGAIIFLVSVLRTDREDAIRAYQSDSTYLDTLDAFAAEYESMLATDVVRDLRDALDRDDITVDENVISAYADSISHRCRSMCRALQEEIVR